MKYFKFFVLIITILPLLSCQKSKKSLSQLDNKSYIKEFEIVKENNNNQTSVKITSPKAIIDQTISNIEILESLIEIYDKNGSDLKVKSGYSTLNNLNNSIRVFNNVNISFIKNKNYFITTNSFDWDLNSSIIDINNPVYINFDKTKINATSGMYYVDSGLLKIYNSVLMRNIYNSEGEKEYHLKIKSDFAKWFKKNNTLVFKSNEKQVETTINFLLTE